MAISETRVNKNKNANTAQLSKCHRIYGGKKIIKRQERSRSKTNFTRPSNGEDDTVSKVERNGRHRFSGICGLRWNSKNGLKRIWPPRRQRDMDSFKW